MSKGDRYIPMTYFESLEQARTTLREESLLALEKQIEYMEYLNSTWAPTFFERFMESYGGARMEGGTNSLYAAHMLGDMRRLIGEAPTYFVSRDMTEMISMAAEDIPAVGVSPADMLTASGFLYFHHQVQMEGPAGDITTDDPANGGLAAGNFGSIDKTETIGIRAIAWEQAENIVSQGKERPGIVYYLFLDPEHLAEARLQQEAQEMAEIARAAGQPIVEPITHLIPKSLQNEVLRDIKTSYGPVILYDFSGWAYGRPWEVIPYDEPARPDTDVQGVHPVVDRARRLLLATWTMLNQKIVQIESERPPRPMRRRAGRVMPETGDVVVIRLRREYHPNGGEDEAALRNAEDGEPWFNHRFLVRGHWRRQPYGKEGDTKLIWIAPYIKGPGDRPLIVKSKVWSLEV